MGAHRMQVVGISAFVVVGTLFLVALWALRRRLHARERELERKAQELAVSRAAEQRLVEELAEARRAEEEARRAREEAMNASRSKSAFLANMSHELRTPLNSILGFAQLVERDPSLADRHRENLAVICKSGEHLLGLVNDILEMAKIEAGRMTLVDAEFDLHDTLSGLSEMFAVEAQKRGLTLTVERAQDVPRHVHGDEGKLRQVLINLLGNALKFTPRGSVTLRASARRSTGVREGGAHDGAAGRVRVSFEVADTGRGMAKAELAELFEAFAQTATGRQSREGTGLGLHISRRIVRMMGGDIRVESQAGRGTTLRFDVRLSLVDAPDARAGGAARHPAALRAVGLSPGQPRYRVLVVDDRWDVRHCLLKLLDAVGIEARSATNGLGAVAQWETWAPHLVLLDLRMPLLDGYETASRIKSSPRGHETVVVAMTASAFEQNRALAAEAGCDDFVSKPFRDADILGLLTKHLGARFEYEERAAEPGAAQGAPAVDLARAAAGLPAALRKDLRRAATRLDAKAVQATIDRFRPEDAELAGAVAELARGYRFDSILALSSADEEEPS
ncbi:ATP-binding protein [Sorangium atrum]|uniref:histidine kinase n=1 Tax=Sorangium atrum TaxID=2995308 RepID=A0ABT5BYE5_9BACT|nr:ATP-binding protein [Sorangium aterium]MDC0679174.1 ATP-binding protein [Sorangium aterium]